MSFKKAVLTGVFILAGISASIAQDTDKDTSSYNYVRPANEKNISDLNNCLSIGFGTGGYYPYYGVSYLESPNVIFTYEHTTLKHAGPGNISLGALFSYKQVSSIYENYSNGYNYTQEWNYYIAGIRVVYDLVDFPSRTIEPYAGAMIAYYFTNFKFTSDDPDYSEPGDPGYYLTPNNYPSFFAPSIFAGIRTRFSSHGSAWLEAGYGYTTFAFGLSYKI
jgi:hypothetical protein